MSETATRANVGKVAEIEGVVVDAVFPDRLPAIYNALRIQVPEADGPSGNRPHRRGSAASR